MIFISFKQEKAWSFWINCLQSFTKLQLVVWNTEFPGTKMRHRMNCHISSPYFSLASNMSGWLEMFGRSWDLATSIHTNPWVTQEWFTNLNSPPNFRRIPLLHEDLLWDPREIVCRTCPPVIHPQRISSLLVFGLGFWGVDSQLLSFWIRKRLDRVRKDLGDSQFQTVFYHVLEVKWSQSWFWRVYPNILGCLDPWDDAFFVIFFQLVGGFESSDLESSNVLSSWWVHSQLKIHVFCQNGNHLPTKSG